jgi:HEAT repeat protein
MGKEVLKRIIIGVKLATILFFMSASSLATEPELQLDSCETPELCYLKVFKEIDRKSRPGWYPKKNIVSITNKLLSFDEDGMPFIIMLLRDKDELVARVGAIALREADNIDEKYLPDIVEGLEREVAWLTPALAKIGTAQAADIAMRAFINDSSSPHNQKGFAIRLFGDKVLPFVNKAIRCDYGCDDETAYRLGAVLKDMEDLSLNNISYIVSIATNTNLTMDIRNRALEVIAVWGEAVLPFENTLYAIKKSNSAMQIAVDNALLGIKSKHSIEIIVSRLASGDIYSLHNIAQLGEKGRSAGREVLKLIDTQDMDLKIRVISTLASIKYKKATRSLMRLMVNEHDVKLNIAVVDALGKLRATEALSLLNEKKQFHWHPSVRRAATDALGLIEFGENYKKEDKYNDSRLGHTLLPYLDLKACKNSQLSSVEEPTTQKLYSKTSPKQLKALAFNSQLMRYKYYQERNDNSSVSDIWVDDIDIKIDSFNEQEVQAPALALRVKDGWLAGNDRGEWGGELVFVSDSGEKQMLLNKNIEDVYKLGDRTIILAGLAHMGLNEGIIYELNGNVHQGWDIQQWRSLPGAPMTSWFVETGELLINTHSGGSLLLNKNGNFRMAECASDE